MTIAQQTIEQIHAAAIEAVRSAEARALRRSGLLDALPRPSGPARPSTGRPQAATVGPR